MSADQPTLTDFQTTAEAEPPAWAPHAGTRDTNRCQRCGAHCSADFVRVFGVGDRDEVHGCYQCYPRHAIPKGATKPGCHGGEEPLEVEVR